MALHFDELTDDLLLQPESRTNNSLIPRLASAGHLDRNYIDVDMICFSGLVFATFLGASVGFE